MLVRVAHTSAFSQFITLVEQIDRKRPNLLPVLAYHRVGEPYSHSIHYPRIAVKPHIFDQQMCYLAENYHVISMPELLDVVTRPSPVILPPRSLLITFDDAYRDFAEVAWPILKRYQLPVTLFVPTAFPDQPEQIFWWDWLYYSVNTTTCKNDLETPLGRFPLATIPERERTFSRLRDHAKLLHHADALAWVEQICDQLQVSRPNQQVLGWKTLRQLAHEGVILGAHTRTHPLMHRISPEEAEEEAVESLDDLEREIGSALPIFAYPSGGFNDEVVKRLHRAGFILAFTTMPGMNVLPNSDWLRLRRINVNQNSTLSILRAQLLPSTYFKQSLLC